jgi:hypothetical protein
MTIPHARLPSVSARLPVIGDDAELLPESLSAFGGVLPTINDLPGAYFDRE